MMGFSPCHSQRYEKISLLRFRDFTQINNHVFSSPLAIPASLERRAIFNQRPRLLGKDDPSILMFFHGEDQRRTAPGNRRMELIAIGAGGYGRLTIHRVVLQRVLRYSTTAPDGSFDGQLGIAVVDVQSHIALATWRRAFVTLFPRPRKIWICCPAHSGSNHKQHRQQTQKPLSFHLHRPQKSNRTANWISRGVPEPTGVIGLTMAVFKLTVLMMLPNPAGPDGLKVD